MDDLSSGQVKVLLVDDDEVDQQSICRAFAKADVTNPVICATDGVRALEILRGDQTTAPLSPPYMVLLDLNMPRMGGLEFLRELRDDPALSSTLVMVLSTSDSDADRLAAYELNIAGYITKARAAEDFSALARLLDTYWRIIEMPV